jgi:hypothetical protein
MGDLLTAALELLELGLSVMRRWPKTFAALLALLILTLAVGLRDYCVKS